MVKLPILLKDIEDILEPNKLRNQLSNFNLLNVNEYIYKLARVLGELLKTNIELKDNVEELNKNVYTMIEEIRMLREVMEDIKELMNGE